MDTRCIPQTRTRRVTTHRCHLPTSSNVLIDSNVLNITTVTGRNALIVAAKTGNLKAIKAFLPLTSDLNVQTIESATALSVAAEKGHQSIVEALLHAGAEIEPQEPGPHCSFLNPGDRVSDFGQCACTSALFSKHDTTFRAIMNFLAQREPQSEYPSVLRSLDVEGWDSFNFEGFKQALKEVMAQVQEIRSEGKLYESEMAPMFESLIATGKNPFSRFVGRLLVKTTLKHLRNQDFMERNLERADGVVNERKRG